MARKKCPAQGASLSSGVGELLCVQTEPACGLKTLELDVIDWYGASTGIFASGRIAAWNIFSP